MHCACVHPPFITIDDLSPRLTRGRVHELIQDLANMYTALWLNNAVWLERFYKLLLLL